jgi:hypothetical protein
MIVQGHDLQLPPIALNDRLGGDCVEKQGGGRLGGLSSAPRWAIGGANLTATKACLLLMACLLKFGSLPQAADPDRPSAAETARRSQEGCGISKGLRHALSCRPGSD